MGRSGSDASSVGSDLWHGWCEELQRRHLDHNHREENKDPSWSLALALALALLTSHMDGERMDAFVVVSERKMLFGKQLLEAPRDVWPAS